MRAGARPPQRHSRAASGASAAPRPRCCPGHHRPVACAAAGGTGAGGGGAPSSLASGVRTAEAAGAVAAVQPPPPAPAPLPPPRPGPPSLVYVCDVEERALQNALRTAEAAEAGTLPRRALAYAAVDDAVLSAAYDRCGTVTEDYGRTFYMVWCRRTDELVDGPNSPYITPAALDRWTERLDAVFAGRPFDLLDAALTDTVASFPVDVTPFYDMIDGMRMDLVKSRYETFTELAEYCYRVAGTVALMCVPIMGLSPEYSGPREPVFRAALALGMANQLTNILRDVGEDARQRGRVYIPLEDLRSHGISDTEVVNGSLAPPGGPVDPRWKALMAAQIARARGYFAAAEAGVSGLDRSARWPVWAALILYSRILDAIEANGYDSFNVRAYVPGANKLALLPFAFAKAQLTPTLVYAAPAAAAPAAAAAAAAKAQEGAAAGAVAEAEAEARAAHAR